jgi:DNA (cytosine-5)-methyltransferase 1
MLTPQHPLDLAREIVVDLFAGGGGASTGIEQALGYPPHVAINHDPEAVALHQANHPQTRHFVSDVFEVDPLAVTEGRPVGLLWASPDCKHFSKAKGGKPVSKKIRALADVIAEWAEKVAPRVICMENVEEFVTWGELDEHGYPIAEEKGKLFDAWRARFTACGYSSDFMIARASDYGAPTIRKRLFGVFRRDGTPIVWPEPTHAAPGSLPVRARKAKPWRTAADCIDWSLPCPSIFERTRELADATKRRIAKGVMRYVVEAKEPFIVRIGHTGHGDAGKVRAIGEPLSTVTSKNEHLLVAPHVAPLTHHDKQRGQDAREPLRTITGAHRGEQALVAAFLAKHYGGVVGSDLREPMGTVTSVDHHSLVAANLAGANATISAGGQHHGEVRAFLIKYYGSDQDPQLAEPLHTVTTKHRHGLVMVAGEPYAIVDIGLRMLSPRELYRAQGFPDSYIIDRGADGRALTKTAQVRMCGNSVCPPLARAIVAANYAEPQQLREAA